MLLTAVASAKFRGRVVNLSKVVFFTFQLIELIHMRIQIKAWCFYSKLEKISNLSSSVGESLFSR